MNGKRGYSLAAVVSSPLHTEVWMVMLPVLERQMPMAASTTMATTLMAARAGLMDRQDFHRTTMKKAKETQQMA